MATDDTPGCSGSEAGATKSSRHGSRGITEHRREEGRLNSFTKLRLIQWQGCMHVTQAGPSSGG
jgi:hypothetical protein